MKSSLRNRFASSLGALALAALSAAGQGYSVEKIPGNPWGLGSSASYLGDNGYVITPNGIYHNGAITTVPAYGGSAVSLSAINGSGVGVGTYYTGVNNQFGSMTGTVRVSGSAVTPINAGGTSNQPNWIGDDGTVLGTNFTYPNSVTRADGWVLKNGVQTTLKPLSTAYGAAIGVAANANGVIVGSAASSNGAYYYHATRWVDNVVQDLGTDGAAYKQSQSEGIDAAGDILVELSQDIFNDGYTSTAIWKNGTMTLLPTFGGLSTRSTSMNALGVVSGESQDANGDYHSFLWDSVHGMTRLDSLASGTSFSNILISKINDQGQLIGNGFERQPDGSTVVWGVLLTPQAVPEPTSLAALGLGALAVARRRRRAPRASR